MQNAKFEMQTEYSRMRTVFAFCILTFEFA
jgi:hypothetical protein